MRTLVVGLGVQGQKRLRVAGDAVVATVDPVVPGARYRSIERVPLDSFDAALVCTPDGEKLPILKHLLSHGKHVLVEKPLLAGDEGELARLAEIAETQGATCYTAYNHRFEPQLVRLRQLLDEGVVGKIYLARLFYGNGTALDVKRSAWRDRGMGVLSDLGSHLLDLSVFLFGPRSAGFRAYGFHRFENRAFDHVLFGSEQTPVLELEAALVCWRNAFTVDVFGERGTLHVQGLCKWGPSTLTRRKRVFPSGPPEEQVETITSSDPTWEIEYRYFRELCRTAANNLAQDRWIYQALRELGRSIGEELPG